MDRSFVAEQSDVVFTIVGFPSDVREVVLGPTGALAGMPVRVCPGRYDHERTFPRRRDL